VSERETLVAVRLTGDVRARIRVSRKEERV
jgi:hypothetical protein